MIEIKHLKTIELLEKTGSLTATASHLHLTQSALSHQIADLERRLGYKIFVRKSQPIAFTPQGSILLNLAQQLLPMVEEALSQCHHPQKSHLKLAIECHSCIQWLVPAIEEFRQLWPKIEVHFESGVTFDPQPALQKGELDLVMTSDILINSNLCYIPLFDFEVRLVCSPSHILAKADQIIPEDLANETLLTYPLQKERFDIWNLFLQPAGVSPVIKTVDNTLVLIQMVSAQMGIAALPHWAVEPFEKQGLVATMPLGNGLWRRLFAAVRDGEQKHVMIQSFTAIVCNHVREHLAMAKPCSNF